MKLYQPPLKKSQMPHKDPFLTRQIVPRPGSMKDGKLSVGSKSHFGSHMSRENSHQAYATVNGGSFPRVHKASMLSQNYGTNQPAAKRGQVEQNLIGNMY